MKIGSDYLKLHAKERLHQIAVIDHDQKITYGQFYHNFRQVVTVLGLLNLPKGSHVGIEWAGLYSHWLLVLACEHLGLISFSFFGEESSSHQGLLSTFDLIISQEIVAGCQTVTHQPFSTAWLKQVTQTAAPDDVPPSPLNPEDLMRIQCSSGTTGSIKYMYRSQKLHSFRIQQIQEKELYDEASHVALFYAFPVQSAHVRACACLQVGGKVILDTRLSPVEMIRGNIFDISHATLMPDKVIQILAAWPKGAVKLNKLCLSTFGGKLSDVIRERSLALFAKNVIESYGTNEAGSLATVIQRMEGYDTAKILPDVQLDVVNDSGDPVLNQRGHIRVRGPGLVNGYIGDPLSSAERFIDGWFYPGDYGVKIDADHIKVIGRSDDLVNVGGQKVNAADIENQIRPHMGGTDFCIFNLIDKDQNDVIWIAVTRNSNTDVDQVQNTLNSIASQITTPVKVQIVDHIPRTPNGKIKRKLLKSHFSQLP